MQHPVTTRSGPARTSAIDTQVTNGRINPGNACQKHLKNKVTSAAVIMHCHSGPSVANAGHRQVPSGEYGRKRSKKFGRIPSRQAELCRSLMRQGSRCTSRWTGLFHPRLQICFGSPRIVCAQRPTSPRMEGY